MANNNKKKTIAGIATGVAGASQSIQDLLKRIQTEGITGPGGKMLQAPTLPALGGAGVGVGAGAGVGVGAGVGAQIQPKKDPKDALIDQLTKALTSAREAPSTVEQLTELQEERGIPRLKETIGTFDEEIGKAQDLLADLDARIRRGVEAEKGEVMPLHLETGRTAALERQAAIPRADILSTIERLQSGKERAESTLEREEADILMVLGLKEKERTQPLEALATELDLRKSIRDLTKLNIPNAVSSTFDDAGNLTIVTQDPDTGEFSTETIAGIGEKAAQYTNIYTQTNSQGDVTFFGIDKEGKVKKIDTFVGVAKSEAEGQGKEFWSAIKTGVASLQKGEEWGNVWNRVRAQFPEAPGALIDQGLGGGYNPETQEYYGWAKPGEFQRFKKATGTSPDNFFNQL